MGDVGVENANEKDDTDTGVGRGKVWQKADQVHCVSLMLMWMWMWIQE